MKVIIAQKYLSPYRVNLFNKINSLLNGELVVVYYGKKEKRRRWKHYPSVAFGEKKVRVLSVKIGYEKNLELCSFPFLWLLKSQADFIVCAPDAFGMFAVLMKFLLRHSVLIWFEGWEVTEGNTSKLKKAIRAVIFRHTTAFFVPGEAAKRYLMGYQPNKEFYLVPNTVDDERFSITELDLLAKYESLTHLSFTFSGSLTRRKGIDLLVEAFEKLESRDYDFTFDLRIMGHGTFHRSTHNWINFLGFIEGDDYSKVFKSSHVFVLPSRHDCNPLTIIEALKSGNIILCSDGVGNHFEFVRENGFVFRRDDITSLEACLEEVLSLDISTLRAMALNSLEISRQITHHNSAMQFVGAFRRQD